MEQPDILDAPVRKKKPPRPIWAAVAFVFLGLSVIILVEGYTTTFDTSPHDKMTGSDYRYLAWPLGVLYATVVTFLAQIFVLFARLRKERMRYFQLMVFVTVGMLILLLMGTLFYALPELGVNFFP